MQPVLYSFNTYTVNLSSPPPIGNQITQTVNLSANVQGTTKIYLNYNQLSGFDINPYKIVLNWDGQDPVTINNVWFNSVIDPILTSFLPNSAYSYTVLAPIATSPVYTNSSALIYYENGGITTFNLYINVFPDNTIDLDLDVLDIQNMDIAFGTIYNLQSNRDNVVYNINDTIGTNN
jgi:hypothetical protein